MPDDYGTGESTRKLRPEFGPDAYLTDDEYWKKAHEYGAYAEAGADPMRTASIGPSAYVQPLPYGQGNSGGNLGRADFYVPRYGELTDTLRQRATDVLGRTYDDDIRAKQFALADQIRRYATGEESISKLQLQ